MVKKYCDFRDFCDFGDTPATCTPRTPAARTPRTPALPRGLSEVYKNQLEFGGASHGGG